jgi:hypothetical protein
MKKVEWRMQRTWQQTQDVIQAVFTTRVVLLVLATFVLWGSGGYIRENACKSSNTAAADVRELPPAGHPGARQLSSSSSAEYHAVVSDVPGGGPPYILPPYIHQTVEDKTAMSCQVKNLLVP